jgi:hypothetical protein
MGVGGKGVCVAALMEALARHVSDWTSVSAGEVCGRPLEGLPLGGRLVLTHLELGNAGGKARILLL